MSFAADSDAFGDWSAEIRELTGREVEVSVETTADCIVGEWKMAIDVRAKDGRDSAKYTHKKPVYVLFNPWCKSEFTATLYTGPCF